MGASSTAGLEREATKVEREEKGPCRRILNRSPDRHIRSFSHIMIHTLVCLRGSGEVKVMADGALGSQLQHLLLVFTSSSMKRSAAVSGL